MKNIRSRFERQHWAVRATAGVIAGLATVCLVDRAVAQERLPGGGVYKVQRGTGFPTGVDGVTHWRSGDYRRWGGIVTAPGQPTLTYAHPSPVAQPYTLHPGAEYVMGGMAAGAVAIICPSCAATAAYTGTVIGGIGSIAGKAPPREVNQPSGTYFSGTTSAMAASPPAFYGSAGLPSLSDGGSAGLGGNFTAIGGSLFGGGNLFSTTGGGSGGGGASSGGGRTFGSGPTIVVNPGGLTGWGGGGWSGGSVVNRQK